MKIWKEAAILNPESYTVTTPDIHLTPPAPRPGYRFTGWYDSPVNGRKVTVIPQEVPGIDPLCPMGPDRPKKPRLPNRICRPGDPPCCDSRQTGGEPSLLCLHIRLAHRLLKQENRAPGDFDSPKSPALFFPYICHSAVSAPTAWYCAALPGFCAQIGGGNIKYGPAAALAFLSQTVSRPGESHEDRRGKGGIGIQLQAVFNHIAVRLFPAGFFRCGLQSRREECRCDPFPFPLH